MRQGGVGGGKNSCEQIIQTNKKTAGGSGSGESARNNWGKYFKPENSKTKIKL